MNNTVSEHPGRLPDRLEALRTRIARIESVGGARAGGTRVVCLGAPEIDGALPWGGLPVGCLHEISGAGERDAAASAFAAFVLARLAGGEGTGPSGHRPVLWITAGRGPYAPALPAFGLDPARVTLVRARRPVDALWAFEEALRCPGLAGVVAEDADPDFPASRRLQLAAADSGVTALLLRPETKALSTSALPASALPASASVTRWRVRPVSSVPGPVAHGSRERTVGAARWQLELLRCRGGRPHEWQVEWRHETNRLRVVAGACDRSSDAGGRQAAA